MYIQANAFFDGVLPPFSNIGNTGRGSTADSPRLRGIGLKVSQGLSVSSFSPSTLVPPLSSLFLLLSLSGCSPALAFFLSLSCAFSLFCSLSRPISPLPTRPRRTTPWALARLRSIIRTSLSTLSLEKAPRRLLRRRSGVPRAMTLTPPARLPISVAGGLVSRPTTRGVSTPRPLRSRKGRSHHVHIAQKHAACTGGATLSHNTPPCVTFIPATNHNHTCSVA